MNIKNIKAIIFASTNKGKFEDIKFASEKLGLRAIRFEDLGIPLPNVEENSDTLNGNSYRKLKSAIKALEKNDKIIETSLLIAEDSGLFVSALNGAPGIKSHRWILDGENPSEKLCHAMAGKQNRFAEYRCFMNGVLLPSRNYFFGEGVERGFILESWNGKEGFGYDPAFHPLYAEEGKSVASCGAHHLHRLNAFWELMLQIERF